MEKRFPLLALPSSGFKKLINIEEKVAIHRGTGELVKWPYEQDPGNFLWTHDLKPYYNDSNPQTYLEKTRQGLDASELFEKMPNIISKSKTKTIYIGCRKISKHSSKGRLMKAPGLRKRKFKKKKYKNSKKRKEKFKDKKRKEKLFNKELDIKKFEIEKSHCHQWPRDTREFAPCFHCGMEDHSISYCPWIHFCDLYRCPAC